MKEGRRHVRPPAAIPRKKFRSITYPQYGTAAKIHNGRLHLSKLGEFRLIGWRKMRGAKKSVTIKFKEGHFWAIVMCEVQECDVCRPYAEVQDVLPDGGIDPGLKAVLSDSAGKNYETPKPLQDAQDKLRHIQKDVSRKFEACLSGCHRQPKYSPIFRRKVGCNFIVRRPALAFTEVWPRKSLVRGKFCKVSVTTG